MNFHVSIWPKKRIIPVSIWPKLSWSLAMAVLCGPANTILTFESKHKTCKFWSHNWCTTDRMDGEIGLDFSTCFAKFSDKRSFEIDSMYHKTDEKLCSILEQRQFFGQNSIVNWSTQIDSFIKCIVTVCSDKSLVAWFKLSKSFWQFKTLAKVWL